MSDKVAVFGASGAQGRLQVHELLAQGYGVRAVTRTADAFDDPMYRQVELVSADYDDPGSLDRALRGCDTVLAQPYTMGDERMLVRQMEAFASALARAKTPLVSFNTSMWAPRTPCGIVSCDALLEVEKAFERLDIPTIYFEPTLFMNNLLGSWIKGTIVTEGVFRYPHKPTMEADWICLEDVARFMVASIGRTDLIGRKIRLGGPQRLRAADVVSVLSEATGQKINYEYRTPREFAQGLWDLYGSMVGYEKNGGNLPRGGKSEKEYVDGIDKFYTFCNDSPHRPFLIDQADLQATIPINRTPMREWARQQDWTVAHT